MNLLKRRALVGVILACFALTATPASATARRVEDPRDVSEDEGGWDIKSAAHGHTDIGRVKHRFTSYTGMDDLMGACLRIVTSKGERFLTCGDAMYDEDNEIVGAVRERRPDNRTVVITFRRAAIGNPASYRWSVRTFGYCQTCDRAPDSGRIRHRL